MFVLRILIIDASYTYSPVGLLLFSHMLSLPVAILSTRWSIDLTDPNSEALLDQLLIGTVPMARWGL